MSFIRRFEEKLLPKDDDPVFKLIHSDIKAGDGVHGIVFPTVRVDRLDFYHGGGVLLQYDGKAFKRNPAYDDPDIAAQRQKNRDNGLKVKSTSPMSEDKYFEKYQVQFTDGYESFKKNNIKRFSKKGKPDERQFLERLYKHTYVGSEFPDVCVLDIEVFFNESGSKKKCDMVLLNTKKCQIMFVEGKLFGDSRMTCGKNDREPEVVEQVKEYSRIIRGSAPVFEAQYAKHISIMSHFVFRKKVELTPELIPDVKLLVYETPSDQEIENQYAYRCRRKLKDKIAGAEIGSMWIPKGKHGDYSLLDIWNKLSSKRSS